MKFFKILAALIIIAYVVVPVATSIYIRYLTEEVAETTGACIDTRLELNITTGEESTITPLMTTWVFPLLFIKPFIMGWFTAQTLFRDSEQQKSEEKQ